MRIRHRRALAAAVAATVLLPIMVTAAPAQADAEHITLVRTGADGRLDVDFDGAPVLWVRLTVLADRTGGAALLTTDNTSVDPQITSEWRTDDPVRLPDGTAFGNYPVDVDYRLQGGTVTHWSGVAHSTDGGQLDYHPHVSIRTASIDEVTSLDHPTATATGTVDAFDPSTGTSAAPPAGTQVQLAYTLGSSSVVTTSAPVTVAADATFSVTVTPGDAMWNARVQPLAPTGVSPGDGYYLPNVEARSDAVRVTATPDRVRLHKGSSATISGTAQRLTAAGWQAVSGVRVVTRSADYSKTFGAGTTDTQGRFTYRVAPTTTTQLVTQAADTPYVYPSSAVATAVSVPTAGRFGVAYHLDGFADITATGKVYGACAGQALTLQYSANGRTSWSKVASVTTAYYTGSPCTFSISGYGYAHGYYRVTHAESDALLAFTTPATYAARTVTRITGLRLSPKHPSATGKLTATGRITQARGHSWVSLGHGLAELVYKPKGDTQYYLMAKAYTSATGAFTLRSKAYGDGDWGVIYQPDGTHLYSETKVTYVDVR